MKTILVDAVGAFIVENNGEFEIFQEMKNLLETFPNQKIILTGAKEDSFEKYCLDKVPYEFFTLRHDPEKTDPRYYKMMLESLGLDKEDVVYFEHSPEAVRSAESVGIKTYLYDSEKKDLKSLEDFLRSNL